MPISRVAIPLWTVEGVHAQEIISPTWPEIERAIRALDQQSHQEVYLYPDENDDETWLAVVGGKGSYAATGSIANDSFPTLRTKSNGSKESFSIMAGGQLSEFPSEFEASLEQVIQVAHAFFNAGGFECGVEWHRP